MIQINTLSKFDSKTVNTLKYAFVNDPILRWAWPDEIQYINHFDDYVKAFAGNSFENSSAYVTDNYHGAALWFSPGSEPDEKAIHIFLKNTLPEKNIEPAFDIIEQMGNHHPKKPHWYLALLGVIPLQQNKGIGSALLQYVLNKCDSEHALSYLEATDTKNIKLYEKYGFKIIGKIKSKDSPPLFPMLREPLC